MTKVFAASFTPDLQECLDLSVDLEVSHKAFPLGLTQKNLSIQKRYCEISIQHKWIKFFESSWIVDVCRTPVHIKKEWGGTQVIRRIQSCTKKDVQKEPFCSEYKSIKNKIQNDGLVFAKGEKEDLVTAHGKVYCIYILLEKYLADGDVLSRYTFPEEGPSKGP